MKDIALLLFVICIISLSSFTGFSQNANGDSGKTRINLEQCHNGNPTAVDCSDPAGNENNWGQGNANSNNSLVSEGDSQNYRIIIENIKVGTWHLVIEQDYTKGGKMAQDFWTGPGNIKTATPFRQGVFPCENNGVNEFCIPGTAQGFEFPALPTNLIPDDDNNPTVLASITAQNKFNALPNPTISPSGLHVYGPVSLVTFGNYEFSGNVNSDSSIKLDIFITVFSPGNVVLVYGGHISNTADYATIPRDTAFDIPGSPYHNRLISFDGINGSPGKQDMQLMTSGGTDPPPPPTTFLTLIKTVINDDGGDSLPDDFNLTVDGMGVLSGEKKQYDAGTPLTINETLLSNYEFVSIEGDDKCPDSLGGTITLDEGDDITCTITNDDTGPPTFLTVIKSVRGGTAEPNDFALKVNGTPVKSGQKIVYASGVPLSINETEVEKYYFVSITGDDKCPDSLGGTITLDEGDDITCTITNKFKSCDPTGCGEKSKPTFGINHETPMQKIVDDGFSFNDRYFNITDNYHTDLDLQSIDIGIVNTFSATVYAPKILETQEFLFGVPEVGKEHEAEMSVEVWYDRNGEIGDVKLIQDSEVIDKSTLSITHQKVKCQSKDVEKKCDKTFMTAVFLEPLQFNVTAIKAIDFKNRYQITYLNEGFVITGDSLNPLTTKMIPGTIKYEGLIEVTQTEKYSNYWVSSDGRIFEMNSFGSFKQINQLFERFQDKGEPRNRLHSGFGEIVELEKSRASTIFDSSELISEIPGTFEYHYEFGERIDEEKKEQMHLQEQKAKDHLKKTYLQARY